jgi:hypothetical protein
MSTKDEVKRCKRCIIVRNNTPIENFLINNINYELTNGTTEVLQKILDGFCGGEMSTGYLASSIRNARHNVLYFKNGENIHSVITYTVNMARQNIHIDAFCANQLLGYKYGYIIFNCLIEAGKILNFKTLDLDAVTTPATINFYKKQGLVIVTPGIGLGVSFMRKRLDQKTTNNSMSIQLLQSTLKPPNSSLQWPPQSSSSFQWPPQISSSSSSSSSLLQWPPQFSSSSSAARLVPPLEEVRIVPQSEWQSSSSAVIRPHSLWTSQWVSQPPHQAPHQAKMIESRHQSPQAKIIESRHQSRQAKNYEDEFLAIITREEYPIGRITRSGRVTKFPPKYGDYHVYRDSFPNEKYNEKRRESRIQKSKIIRRQTRKAKLKQMHLSAIAERKTQTRNKFRDFISQLKGR